jgi:multidrug efflux system membrane fusion protein
MNLRPCLPALLLLAACGKPATEAAGEAAKRFSVEVATAVSEPVLRTITAPGSLAARETVRISARISGVIDRVLVQEGELVAAGQAVAEIEPERHRLAMLSATAQLARATAAREDTASQQRRREQAAKDQPGLISDDELTQVRARTAQAEAEVAVAAAALARTRLDLADARVASPVAGIIQERLAETGQLATPGTVIASVVDRSRVLLQASVPVADAARLRPGLAVAFRVPGEVIDRAASLTLVGEVADPATRLVTIIAQVAEADAADVRPGSFAAVRIDLPPGPARVLVPNLAVKPSAKGFLVYVVEGQGEAAVARERLVTMAGHTRDDRIALAAGVRSGELVVTRGAEALREGSPLNIVAPSSQQ